MRVARIAFRAGIFACVLIGCAALRAVATQESAGMVLPKGVKAVWDLDRAYRETTPTQERVCINGLWRWQPGDAKSTEVPADNWGYFKVPGCWPGISSWLQKDSQTMFEHPGWQNTNLGGIQAAWYQREITIPPNWAGRRIAFEADTVNSLATVYVDGKSVGTVIFPDGTVDLTDACQPGQTHLLSVLVVAVPLKGVMLAFNDTASAREVRGSVERRGLCGDVYLTSTPRTAHIADLKVDPSVRRWQISFRAALADLGGEEPYRLRAEVTGQGETVVRFSSAEFRSNDLVDGRYTFSADWHPGRLWDIHTPENMYDVQLTLVDSQDRTLDVFRPVHFGFREFWIDGKDFYLNGSRIYLSSVPVDNPLLGAGAGNYAAVCESFRRLKDIGINYVYTHNYGSTPGSHLSFEETLRAGDDVGMLIGVTQPHAGQYNWDNPEEVKSYQRLADFYVRVAENHPSVVFYVTSHNSTTSPGDMNPDLMGIVEPKRDNWSGRNAEKAAKAEAIISRLDPSRIVYHHASGYLRPIHNSNFYINFAPVQEMSDWFIPWSEKGVMPLFTCEYAVPSSWDWTMYRGWYKGVRNFGSASAPWEYCIAEWNSQFLGDAAFKISEAEKRNLRWEAEKFRAGALWHRWDYPNQVGSSVFTECDPVYAEYVADNWRAFRALGLSGNAPWSYGEFWRPRPGVDRSRKNLPVDWDNLQRPGLSPDYIGDRWERVDLAFGRDDWEPSVAADALVRNNMPLLACIVGKAGAVTGKDHSFFPGQTLEKQLLVVNNSRQTVRCDYSWSIALPRPIGGKGTLSVETGNQDRVPIGVVLPADLAPGSYELKMTADFSGPGTQDFGGPARAAGADGSQSDSFSIQVMASPAAPRDAGRIALLDPKGETTALLTGMGVRFTAVGPDADLAGYDVLIVGKAALTPDGPAPDISRVRDGLKVVLFEQTSDVLEQRFGLRTVEYGLRRVFARVPDHPLLAGIKSEHLENWTGSATIVPPRLTYQGRSQQGEVIMWCGLPISVVWRSGNRGNVASVLIEKPVCGDFLPIVDGGFSVQYSPLMVHREGSGLVIFCQMDVTGRTESDAAAQTLVRNILNYVATAEPAVAREAIYAGDAAGRSFLESTGLAPGTYGGGLPGAGQVLIVGPGGAAQLGQGAAAIRDWLVGGGHVLAIGLDGREEGAIVPAVRTKTEEHISCYFAPPPADSPLAGLSPADVHIREPRQLPLVSAGADVTGDGVLAAADDMGVVFSQLAPWSFDPHQQNTKRSFRRTSFLTTRLLANMGAAGSTPLLERFHSPVRKDADEKRWLTGFYLDTPEEWDYPYRFFRW
jgi:beta-galactosidase